MLPLPPATEERGAPTGAFASQYVANHLVRDPARPSSPTSGPSGQGEESGVNHTKSLANLSRLFRQLKPQPLHSEGARSKLTVSPSTFLLYSAASPEVCSLLLLSGISET